MARGYLGIDAGTQGMSVVFADESLQVLAVGEGGYEMVAGLDEGCYEQRPADWLEALQTAMSDLRSQLPDGESIDVLAIGISGQMHGEVLCDAVGTPLAAARLWCDARNESEGDELTKLLGKKMPKRLTAARWLWTLRHKPERAAATQHITTPAGWLAFQLTGEWNLGIGDAAGMFPMDQDTLDYDEASLAAFDQLTDGQGVPPLRQLLPQVRSAGEEAGQLTATGGSLLGLAAGIAVAAAEGDQPAALAGSLIGDAGMVSISFGTSVCANSVGDRPFQGVSPIVDHFCAPDGKPINMVFLRNGTTFMNTIVEMFGKSGEVADAFAEVMPQVLAAEPACGGLLALPFMDDEPGLGVSQGGNASILGLDANNASPGNVTKAALLATIFNLRIGSEALDQQGFPRNEIVLSGGLTKTPELAQVVADVMRTKVTLLDSAEEGTAWGAALLAKYRHLHAQPAAPTWPEFLHQHAHGEPRRFTPCEKAAAAYDETYRRYQALIVSGS
jgi:sugar (pentulose or hexulose) kinase